MDEEDINMEAVESVLDDYYNEDDAMLEAEDELWDDDAEMEDEPWNDEENYGIEDDEDEEDSAERRSRSWYRRRAARRRARQRARARALARARSRRARRRSPSRRPPRRYMPPRRTRGKANANQVRKGFNRVSDDVAKTKQKIAKVDLESKVKADALREAVKKQGNRIGGSEYAISATKVIDEITAQFPKIKDDKILKSLLPLAPLAFLKPPKKGTGLESLVKDPRVVGAAIAGAIAIYRGMNPEEKPIPAAVRVGPAAEFALSAGANEQLMAQLLDQNGKQISGANFTWRTLDEGKVKVNAATGAITTVAAGTATIIATSTTDASLTGSVKVEVT